MRHPPLALTRRLARLLTLWCAISALGACDDIEERVVTSPLMQATPLDERGEARVTQTLKAGRYTYIKLSPSPEDTWHVISSRAPSLGTRVHFRGYASISPYTSRTLDRTFDRVIFTTIHIQDTP